MHLLGIQYSDGANRVSWPGNSEHAPGDKVITTATEQAQMTFYNKCGNDTNQKEVVTCMHYII